LTGGWSAAALRTSSASAIGKTNANLNTWRGLH
jgi:hypothetical protein